MTAPSPPSPPRRRNRVGAVLALLLSLALVAGLGLYAYVRTQLQPASALSAPTEFEVLPGWGGNRVASELAAAGLVRDARVFALYLRYLNLDRAIGEGLYDLDPAMSAAEVSNALARGGRPRTVFVVIPEGYRMSHIASALSAAGLGEETAFLAVMRDPGDLRPDFIPEGAPLEGYLFPAGYEIPVKDTPEEVIERMLTRFAEELTPETLRQLEAADLSIPAWVTLASLVQAEAANDAEMPVIAGVFLNRMDRNMLLQSDPTVAYGLGKALPDLDAVAGELRVDTPWNTYTRPGLPATPIDNPGAEALAAVLAPTRQTAEGQDYLYFLHGLDDGAPVFRPNLTLEEHNRDVDRYLR